MQLFYHSDLKSINQSFHIEDQENLHLTKVLRKSIGDLIFITNGKGSLFEAEIKQISKKKSDLLTIRCINTEKNDNLLSLAIAPTKNLARIEWLIEKAVEIGIKEIILFVCQNSERRNVKAERLELKALSAMKQSLKLNLPNISHLYNFKTLIEKSSQEFDSKLIASCKEESRFLEEQIDITKKTIVLIGPEGGFTKEELEYSKQFNFKFVSLGTNRLRTETAGLYVCSIFKSLSNIK